jgi:hypothetical protein
MTIRLNKKHMRRSAMRQKIVAIFIVIISMSVFSSCSVSVEPSNDYLTGLLDNVNSGSSDNSDSYSFTPVSKTLSDKEKALLPYYNNGWTFVLSNTDYIKQGALAGTRDRVIYYLGQKVGLISGRYPIFSNIVAVNDYKIYFFAVDKEESGVNANVEDSSSLYVYDIKANTYENLSSWTYLKKYGNIRRLISNGKNVYLLFKANGWMNVVSVSDSGADELVSKITDDKINIDNVKGWIPQSDGTFMVSNDKSSYNVNVTTADVVKNEQVTNDNSIFVDNSYFNFLPDNSIYTEEKVQEKDELTGNAYFVLNLYKTKDNIKNKFAQIKHVSEFGKIECDYITTKYLFFIVDIRGTGITYELIDLKTGEKMYMPDLVGNNVKTNDVVVDLWNIYTNNKTVSIEK